MKFDKYTLGDLLNKFRTIILVTLNHIIWKMRLGKLGKDSRIYRGFVLDGNPARVFIGRNVRIWHRCIFAVGNGVIELDDNVILGVECYINTSAGSVRIGKNVGIGPFTQIYSYSHDLTHEQDWADSYIIKDVLIKDNVIIGAGTIILPGVTIEEGASVAAGSVVKANTLIPQNTIYGGIPCKFIKNKR